VFATATSVQSHLAARAQRTRHGYIDNAASLRLWVVLSGPPLSRKLEARATSMLPDGKACVQAGTGTVVEANPPRPKIA